MYYISTRKTKIIFYVQGAILFLFEFNLVGAVAIYPGGVMISIKKIQEYQLKRLIKKAFVKIFKQRNLIDDEGDSPKLLNVNFEEYGIIVYIDLKGVCSYSELEKELEYIQTVFKAYEVNLRVIEGICKISIYTDNLEPKSYYKQFLEPYECLLGFNYEGNIIADMRITPHILITGLSGQGKTEMAKTVIRNLQGKADIILLNAFKSDFKAYKGRFIIREVNILLFLKSTLESKIKRSRPMYIIIDELLVLTKNKEISKCITDLLAIARHYNIFLIGISQEGTKEQLKFKSLFNTRVCFRLLEESSYRTVLGCSVEGELKKQEFYLYSNGLYKGRTFDN